MPRLIAFSTCFFWMAVHLLAALAALRMVPSGFLGVALPDPGSAAGPAGRIVFAIAFGAVAAGFLWAFAVVIMGEGVAQPDVAVAVNAAFAGAILLAGASLLILPVLADGSVIRALVTNVAALGASYAAIHAEEERVQSGRAEQVNALARRMAVGAAHDTLLTALSGHAGAGRERT